MNQNVKTAGNMMKNVLAVPVIGVAVLASVFASIGVGGLLVLLFAN